jgi:hypothetical protein
MLNLPPTTQRAPVHLGDVAIHGVEWGHDYALTSRTLPSRPWSCAPWQRRSGSVAHISGGIVARDIRICRDPLQLTCSARALVSADPR